MRESLVSQVRAMISGRATFTLRQVGTAQTLDGRALLIVCWPDGSLVAVPQPAEKE